MCAHDGNTTEAEGEATDPNAVVKDIVGTPLTGNDDVALAKGLDVNGGAGIRVGTKVGGIRLPGRRWTGTTPRRRLRVWDSCT